MTFAFRQRSERHRRLASTFGWVVLFLAAGVAYWPGLSGPFLFDDFGSIGPLGDLGGVTNWTAFKAFVLGGSAGPTGRPLALLTFLIDGNNWPTDAWPFKRTNLIIHLLNGALLGVLIRKILRVLEYDESQTRRVALLATGIWLLHPLLVSTTLYVVQRMAQLSTLFMIVGMIVHLYARSSIAKDASRAYRIMSVSMVVFTSLAMLSKENGILLPSLIGVIEGTVFASQQGRVPALNRFWVSAFILAPTLIIFLYLGGQVLRADFFAVVPPRHFSLYERALTEPRILFDYLQNWFIPKLYTSGIFQDHFAKSSGLLSPPTTLISLLLHSAIISVSLIYRRKWPLFALAALFFYGSHALESTVLNLELYFEHRNYLATVFLFLPLIAVLQTSVRREVFLAVALSTLLMLAGFTRYSAGIWENYGDLVAAVARKAPNSARAQGQYAASLFDAQRYDESLAVVGRAVERMPDNVFLLLTQANILCKLGILADSDINRAATIISAQPYDPRSISVLTTLMTSVVERDCPQVSLDALQAMFTNMLAVPENADPRSLRYSQVEYFVGFVDVFADRPARAERAFEASARAGPGAGHTMAMAALLATHGYHDQALHLSDIALSQLGMQANKSLAAKRVLESDIREFRETVRADRDAAAAAVDGNQ